MVKETHLSVNDLIYPLFVILGEEQKVEIASMLGCDRYSLDLLLKEVTEAFELGINALELFTVISEAKAVAIQLKHLGYRVEVDSSGDRLGKQIRTVELEKIPIVAAIGKREVETNTLSIRTRQAGEQGQLTPSELHERMQQAIVSKQQI